MALTKDELKTLENLRDRGYAIVMYAPDELGSAFPEDVEANLIDLGSDVIRDLQGEW